MIIQAIAILAFFISLWNLLSPYILKLSLTLVPEAQIQLLEAIQEDKKLTAFNVLFTAISKGPVSKWNTYKFIRAELLIPDGRKISFICRAYLSEAGLGQSNSSRNIPLAINGAQSKTTTAAFQTVDFTEWQVGNYQASFYCVDAKGHKISSDSLSFELTNTSLTIIKKPNSTYIVECEIAN